VIPDRASGATAVPSGVRVEIRAGDHRVVVDRSEAVSARTPWDSARSSRATAETRRPPPEMEVMC